MSSEASAGPPSSSIFSSEGKKAAASVGGTPVGSSSVEIKVTRSVKLKKKFAEVR